jgi:hypothetical protein
VLLVKEYKLLSFFCRSVVLFIIIVILILRMVRIRVVIVISDDARLATLKATTAYVPHLVEFSSVQIISSVVYRFGG